MKEIAVSSTNLNLHEAKVSIFHCGTYDYRLADSQILGDIGFADIQFSNRLFNNMSPFLIIRGISNTGWREYYYAIGWNGTEWQEIDLGVGSFSDIALFDHNGDGTKEVFILSDEDGRNYVDTYEWNGTKYTTVSSVALPGSTRLEYFHDAENALSEGNPLLAIANYEIAARNDSPR